LLVLHYFSDDEGILTKTRETLRISRKLGNKAILPTVVLAEFYAQTYKRAGKEVAGKHFGKVVTSAVCLNGGSGSKRCSRPRGESTRYTPRRRGVDTTQLSQ
jgi:hypothetical protein